MFRNGLRLRKRIVAVRHIVILRGGRSAKERREVEAQLASIPITEERLLLATGRYIGEGFDDARLDTLFLAMPVSWKGTLVQYAGRLHRLRPTKREVRIIDYVESKVPMLARMCEKWLVGYRAMGYREDRHCTAVGVAGSDQSKTWTNSVQNRVWNHG